MIDETYLIRPYTLLIRSYGWSKYYEKINRYVSRFTIKQKTVHSY